jgi:hypothetical protein
VTLTNYFPNVSSVDLRGGFIQWATGISGQVESLLDYAAATGGELYAIAGGQIYDATAQGAVGAPVVTGLSNSRWEYANIGTSGGHYIYAVKGEDAPLLYDGTTWQPVTGVSTPFAITGVTTTTLSNVCLFKNRMWFVQKDTLKAWYLPTASVAGAAQPLDLSAIAQHGGSLVAIGTWTIDAGYGVDDNLVFVTDQGEVIVFRGTDPASSATWALAGVWYLGKPVGKRCLVKYGGDMLLISYYGLLPLSDALQSDRLDPRVALSDKIQGAFAQATMAYGDNFGWQIVVDNHNNAVYVNVPVSTGQQQQYVMNNITRAWCNFTGWAANCWEIFENDAYFGGSGFVGKAWDPSYADNNTDIQANALQAFNYFGLRGVQKQFTRARPSIITNGVPSIFMGMNVDFDLGDNTAPLTFVPTTYGIWDSGLWDTAVWATANAVTNVYQGITGIGYSGAINLKSSSQGLTLQWAATDVVYQTGFAGI